MPQHQHILILADDLSGAAEMAAIAWRRGIVVSLEQEIPQTLKHGLTVINTETRSMSKEEARQVIREIASRLNLNSSTPLFKKSDSVLRGHIIAEAAELISATDFNRCFILTANPSRSRIIKNGRYFVEGIPLENTSFHTDPAFPVSSGYLPEILKDVPHEMGYKHFQKNEPIPLEGIFSFDVENEEDLKNWTDMMQPGDFCCGASDAFNLFLTQLNIPQAKERKMQRRFPVKFNVILHGSTIRNIPFEKEIGKNRIPQFELPSLQSAENELPEPFYNEIKNVLTNKRTIYLSAGTFIAKNSGLSKRIEKMLGETARLLYRDFSHEGLHLYVTGGATATAVIGSLGINRSIVEDEPAKGVVTLSPENKKLYLTVKPGSYQWPETILEKKK